MDRLGRLGTRLVAPALALIAVVAAAKLAGRADRLVGDHMSFYLAARSLVEDRNPYLAVPGWYHRYVYPPLFAWLVAPLTLAGPRAFALAWWAIIGACWLAALALTRRVLGGPRRAVHPAVAALPALLLIRPIFSGWGLGQIASPLLAMMLAALLALRTGRARLAGALLGLAGAVKLFPVYLALLFVRMRRTRALEAMVRAGALASALPALTLGVPRLAELLFAWFPATAEISIESQRLMINRYAIVTSLWREMKWCHERIDPAQLAWAGACSAVVLALGVPRRQRSFWLWCGLAMTTMVVAAPLVHTNYLGFLLFPYAAMLHVATGRPPGDPLRRTLPLALAGATLAFTCARPGLVEAGLLFVWGAQVHALAVLGREERIRAAGARGSPARPPRTRR